MIFTTRVNGIPCQCLVTNYAASIPMKVYGPGMGDASPPEPEEFDYEILDRRGRRANWLDKYITTQVHDRIAEEFTVMQMAEYYANEPMH